MTDSRAQRQVGVASLALRDLLSGPRRPGRVLVTMDQAVYLEFPDAARQPRVITVSPPGLLCLPNAVIAPPGRLAAGDLVTAGDGRLTSDGAEIKITRWWDPSPVFGPLSRARLDHGTGVLARLCRTASHQPGLTADANPALAALAEGCAAGDLATAVEAAETLTGLGPGLVPSGDALISGVLLALRLLGGAISGGTKAVWLADWLGAAATCHAAQRTTAIATTLLHCAASGQAAAQVSAVLLGLAGQEPLEPAATRLLGGGGPSADLAWGLVAGCRAALRLSVS